MKFFPEYEKFDLEWLNNARSVDYVNSLII